MADKVKWAVIGAGGIARRRTIPEGIVPALNAELIAVYDPRSGREVADQFSVPCCESEEELLASDCDVVYIATPVNLHQEQVLRAAAAGKHVMCEKPLGLDVDEAAEMVEACRDARVKLGVGLLMRFLAQHREALRLVNDGAIGKPVFGRAQLSCWYPPIEGAWRQDANQGGGGSLMDMACHTVDLLEMFLGRATRVSCFAKSLVQAYGVEDTGVAILEFESGACGTIDSLFNVPDRSVRNRLEVYGSAGSILAEGTIGQSDAGDVVLYRESSDGNYDPSQRRRNGEGERISPVSVNMYRAEVEAFSAAILEDARPPVDGEDGLWNQHVLAGCYESARTGCAVTL